MKLSAFFDREEFACKCGCGLATVDSQLLQVLEGIRSHYRRPVVITSGHRCKKHNSEVGGGKNSYHLQGRAADIKVVGVESAEVYEYVCATHKDKYGFILYDTFVHVDSRDVPYRNAS